MIGEGAFAYCDSLTEVYIPASVKTVNKNTFYFCKGLKTVTFAEKSQLEEISSFMFTDCNNLEKVNIPASVKILGSYAFIYCRRLKEVSIAANSQLQTIKGRVFSENNELPTITIPSGVTSIGNAAFDLSSALRLGDITMKYSSYDKDYIKAICIREKSNGVVGLLVSISDKTHRGMYVDEFEMTPPR